jgi:hypothetical protein
MKPRDRRALLVFGLFCATLGTTYVVQTISEEHLSFVSGHAPTFSERFVEGDWQVDDRIYTWKGDWRKVRADAYKEMTARGVVGKPNAALWESETGWDVLVSEGRAMDMTLKPGFVTVRMWRRQRYDSWVKRWIELFPW